MLIKDWVQKSPSLFNPKLTLGTRITLSIGLVVGLVSLAVFITIYSLQQQQVMSRVETEAKSVLTSMVLIREWAADYGGVWTDQPGDVYLEEKNGFYRKTPAMITKELSALSESKDFYRFTTADPTVTAATLFGMIESYISDHLDRARQDSLNAYKLRMEGILQNFVDTLNEAVSQMQNELNKELAEALGTAHDSGRIQEIGDINIPPMNISIPLSCVETTEKERLVTVPDGYRKEKVKKQRMVERAWYNPLRWVGKGAYLDEYEETENKAVYKTRLEKEYQLTIDPAALKEKLEQRIRQGIEAWKENDTLQIYISLDKLIEQYISFFNSMEKEKRDEIYQLKADLADQESRKKAEMKNFKAFQRDLNAALPAR